MRKPGLRFTLAALLLASICTGFLPASSALATLPTPTWQVVGAPGFSAGIAYYTSLEVSRYGQPYVFYQDLTRAQKGTVRKFNGYVWEDVGATGFTEDGLMYPRMAVDWWGTPYVAFQDWAHGAKATVMKYTEGSWQTVPANSPGFTPDEASYLSMVISRAGVPYVVFSDKSCPNKATVMKFSEGAWSNVGTPCFSETMVSSTAIALDQQGVPYVAYLEGVNGGVATVKRFSGGAWQLVGQRGFSPATAEEITIAIDSLYQPYVAFRDGGQAGKATVMRFGGSQLWQVVGTRGFSAGTAASLSIVLGEQGTPYVAFKDVGRNNRASVLKFDSSGVWSPVEPGNPAFSAGEADSVSMALSGQGAIYVAYTDWSVGKKATAMTAVVQEVILPVVTLTTDPSDQMAGATGWYNIASSGTDGVIINAAAVPAAGQAAIVGMQCMDNGGVVVLDTYGSPVKDQGSFVLHDGVHRVICGAEDANGAYGAGAGSTVMPAQFAIDQATPTTIGIKSPSNPNSQGWYHTPVNVTFGVNDGTGSGVGLCEPPSVTLSENGPNQSVTGICADKAGNPSPAPVTISGINIDQNFPVITAQRSPEPNGEGWNKSSVTVSFTCSESAPGSSGVMTNTVAGQTVSTEGAGQVVMNTGACADRAGNVAEPVTLTVNLDKTAPMLNPSVTPPKIGQNRTGVADPGASDTVSGIAAASCVQPRTDVLGTHTTSCQAADKAGNTASANVAYEVFEVRGQLFVPVITKYK